MSIIAKVFSIVVLVLSVVFVSMALALYGERVHWKPKFYMEKAQNIELKERYIREVSYARAEAGYYQNIANQKDVVLKQKDERIQQLENEKIDRDNALAVEYQKNFRVVAQLMETVREISRMNLVLKQRQDVITKQQMALQVSRQNEATMAQQVADLKRQNNQLVQLNADITRRGTQLERELAEAQGILDSVMKYVGDVDPSAMQNYKPINGHVVGVDAQTNFVTLDKGTQDGVEIGYKFWIYRDDKLIGRVRVKQLHPDMSGAEIIPEFIQGVIKEQDSAATDISRLEY